MSSPSEFPLIENRRWWQFAGPWPFRPVLIFVASWLFYNITAVGALTIGSTVNIQTFLVTGLVQALISSLPITAAMVAGREWQRRRGVRWGSYVAFIAAGAAGTLTLRYLLVIRDSFGENVLPAMLVATGRTVLFLFIILGLAGAVTERLQRQVVATQEALKESRRQQERILRADEDARRQVAELLHDRVQAGLIAACMELQALPDDDELRRASVSATIRHLESLRSIDVRGAARALSPSLQDVDLRAALRDLAAQYEPSMVTTVEVPGEVEMGIRNTELRLALYRVAEQALMNAAKHGRARNVEISLRFTMSDVVMQIRDDGKGLAQGVTSEGLGSALITTWTRRFGGRWSLTSGPDGGAVLDIHFPAISPSVD